MLLNALPLSRYSISVITEASFSIVPPHGWAKCLGVLYTKAFHCPVVINPHQLAQQLEYLGWGWKLSCLGPSLPRLPVEVLKGPLGQCHKAEFLSSLSLELSAKHLLPLGLWDSSPPQHSLLSPHRWDPPHYLFKKLSMSRKRKKKHWLQAASSFRSCKNPSGGKY